MKIKLTDKEGTTVKTVSVTRDLLPPDAIYWQGLIFIRSDSIEYHQLAFWDMRGDRPKSN